jgi:hypothetical protein
MAAKPRKTNSWPLVAVLAIAAIAIAVGYLAFQAPGTNPVKQVLNPKSPLEKAGAVFEQQYGKDFATYSDPDYGFSLKYPLGYKIDKGFTDDARVIVYAVSAEGAPETFTVGVDNASVGQNEFDGIVQLYDPQYVESATQTTINSANAYILSVVGPDEYTNSNSTMHQAFVSCKRDDGLTYTAILTAMVPRELGANVPLMDYMISSFRC